MVFRDKCPACGSARYKRNGHIHNSKQNYKCKHCGRQFVQCCEHYRIAEDKRRLIERLFLERLSLRGICRAVGVGLKELLGFLVTCCEVLPDHLHVQPIICHGNVMIRRLEVAADERSSFVQKKASKQWI
jgi:insertion element IS1 protein InsB